MLQRSSRVLNPLSKSRCRPQTTLLSTATTTRVAELATRIQQGTSRIDEYLQKKHLPAPSFDEDGPVELGLPSDLDNTRIEVIDASLELHQLLLGPSSCLRPTVCIPDRLTHLKPLNIALSVTGLPFRRSTNTTSRPGYPGTVTSRLSNWRNKLA